MAQSTHNVKVAVRQCLSRSSPVRFLLLSLVFHLVYIYSVFDIYFTSPVVHPESRFSIVDTFPPGQGTQFVPPANRLVLIVADGLRADTLFRKHPVDHLPVWARNDLALFSSAKDDSAEWHGFEQNPLQLAYPYRHALYSEKETRSSIAAVHSSVATSSCRKDSAQFASPFLRSIAKHRGVWGLSHTRVPTESRPGHVAMIAGMYEDVSAVTKGWKLNPIAFDSVLNQSTHSFAFGSPDIVPMFAVGAASDRVDMWTYDDKDEDFTKDASHLDLWVLRHLQQLFDDAKQNASLAETLYQPGTVFFLHLLGLDTTGHTYRPFSPEYIGNTIVVDDIAREVERMFNDFYNHDDKTSYIFTADHGMSVKGNHGDGDPDNTRTPIVAWGAGVRRPRPAVDAEVDQRRTEASNDAYYRNWQLDHISRVDVDQADIAPLMTTLIGAPIPANSEGKLRIDMLSTSEEHRVRALLANAMQVLETYRVKHDDRKRRMIRFVPFAPLQVATGKWTSDNDALPGSDRVANIMQMIEAGDWTAAASTSEELISLALEGAGYLQTYDWLLLCIIVTAGYLGSIGYGFAFLLQRYVLPEVILEQLPQPHALLGTGKLVFASLLGIVFATFARQEMPWTYFLYAGFATLFWSRIIDQRRLFTTAYRHWSSSRDAPLYSRISFANLALSAVLAVLTLGLIVAGYLHRPAWLLGFLAIGFLWPTLFLSTDFKSENEGILLLWGLCCLCSGLFTIADVNKDENILILILSGISFMVAGIVVVAKPECFFPLLPAVADPLEDPNREKSATQSAQQEYRRAISAAQQHHLQHTLSAIRVQLAVLAITTLITAGSARSLQLKRGLASINQIAAWSCLVFSLLFPFVYGFRPAEKIKVSTISQRLTTTEPLLHLPHNNLVTQPHAHRLALIVFSFAPIFVLLSLRDETLFFGCFTVNLLLWAKLEGILHEETLSTQHTTTTVTATTTTTPNQSGNGNDTATAPKQRWLQPSDLRISLFFLFFLHVGFFGTGNVASISSFYLSPVYRLVPIFNPFLMATLLLVKILIPFVILSIVFQAMCASSPNYAQLSLSTSCSSPRIIDRGLKLLGSTAVGGLGLDSCFGLVFGSCILADLLALTFLYAVKSQGSWLEIGQTITHFVMANLLQIFMLTLAAISSMLLQAQSGSREA